MKKAFRVVSGVLFAILFIGTMFLVTLKFMGEKPAVFGYQLFYVMTGSMEPMYSSGDLLLGRSVEPETLQVGDVVTYEGESGELSGKMITHQIVSIQTQAGERIFVTQGLANQEPDQPITQDAIQARIIGKIPLLGQALTLINHKWGFFVVIILPLAVLLGNEVVSLIRICKKEKEGQGNETSDQMDLDADQTDDA